MKRSLASGLLLITLILLTGRGITQCCEVMGFSFNQPVSGRHLFADFRHRSVAHPDGWGVVLYPDKSAQLFKEGTLATESPLAEFLTHYEGLKAEILIAFVRSGSPGCGGPAHQNSHPFLREWNGTDFVLAHEGTIHDFRAKLKLGRATPLGINDSEFLLCYLVGRLDEAGIKQWDKNSFEWFDKLLQQTSELGTVTCMFSDGEYLFVYLDKRDTNDLYQVRREAPYGKVYFKHEKREIDLGQVYPKSAKGVVFATRPLTNETWKPLRAGTLTVLKKGQVVYTTAE